MSNVDCQLVIFDMDGTLTRPNINFDEIRAAIGLDGEPILEALAKMPPADRARADAILQEFEDRAADGSELQPHALEVVAAIRESGRPAALMTRNTRRSVDIVMRRHRLDFDFIRTRDDGINKPAPDPVLDICRHFRVAPASTWVIGDYHFDIQCANAAGAISVHLAEAFETLPPWSNEARHIVKSLLEFSRLLGIRLDTESRPILPGA
ncbi:MAG: HAD family hydrolase [Phycisphaerales bacterium]|nr:HAD family hydrolase [Phycisphaerales bacterium]MCB9857351.1 HAD family hydrolase [Phycisphaerales bacterium]